MRDNLTETADDILIDQAIFQFDVGRIAAARATLSQVGKVNPAMLDEILLNTKLGNVSEAETYIAKESNEANPGTLMRNINIPRVRAALLMHSEKPMDAAEALEPARPYELIGYDIPW
jgi:hypothetical protein